MFNRTVRTIFTKQLLDLCSVYLFDWYESKNSKKGWYQAFKHHWTDLSLKSLNNAVPEIKNADIIFSILWTIHLTLILQPYSMHM